MTPLPRQAVFGAAAALFGACFLGLYVGVHDSLDRPIGQPATVAAGGLVPLQPGMATATIAQPLKPDQVAAAVEPVKVAQAKPKTDEEDADEADTEDALAAASDAAKARRPIVVEPPPLYSPDAPPAQASPPPAADNAPPF